MDYDSIDELGEDLSPLDQAKLFLRLGHLLPVDLTTTLIAQGHDVSQLEARYSN